MRYERQKKLVKRRALKEAKVAICGLGGLGSACALYLAAAGVGSLLLIDKDVVEESNLNRQVLYTPKDIGKKKIEVAKERLLTFNPEINIEISEKLEDAIKARVIVDALDNWESREKLWRLAMESNKILVHGAVNEFFGQVFVLKKKEDFEFFMGLKKHASKQVLGTSAGIVGSYMALEVIRILSEQAPSGFVSFDGYEIRRFHIKPKFEANCIIARFGEIGTKSKVTRRKMLAILEENLKKVLGEGFDIRFVNNRFLIFGNLEEAMDKLRFIPGIVSYSLARYVKLNKLEEEFISFAGSLLRPGTRFRVTAHRAWKGYEKTSLEIQAELGKKALAVEPLAKVSLNSYDVELNVEIHKGFALLFTERVKGMGGLPYGVEGKALLLFSGGFDSPVSAYLLAKRGLAIDALFINPLGKVLESKVVYVFEGVKKFAPDAKLYVVNASKLVNEIKEKVREGLRQVVLKRFLYRIGEAVAERVKARAIATGENLGQTSSQTLQSLAVIENAARILILRPLLAYDKEEIISMAKEISTYERSLLVSEFCQIEKHSNARPKLEEVLEEERKIETKVEEVLKSLREARAWLSKDEILSLYAPEELRDFEVVKLWEGLPSLEPGKRYLFVCEQGNKAAELALEAREKGIETYALSLKEARRRGLV